MKKATSILIVLLVLSTIFVLSSCSKKKEISSQTKKVVVSVIPQKYFVEKIAGDKIEVVYMVEKGASPAIYEPKPAQMQEISEAEAYIKVGVPFEEAWLPKFEAANSKMKTFDQGAGVEKLVLPDHVDEPEKRTSIHELEDKQEKTLKKTEEQPDPHIWLSPQRAIKQADNIYEALVAIDEDNQAEYQANLESFKKEIESLDQELSEIISAAPSKTFLVFHPALGYFAADYDLTQVAIEVEGKEPSAKEMVEVLEIAKEKQLQTIFVEPQFNKQSAESIAAQIGASVAEVDPLAEDWAANLKSIARAIGK
ncbi:zinc ABC transporter substrate-binding protein [Patescibacteria group bacterium]|nr:zinc ABC transporter substrate-binding protein [Patescibacteria group bacterium]